MSVTYTNRKNVTYYLGQTVTKTGKPRYTFSREPAKQPVEQVPEGWEISESVNGVDTQAKAKPKLILADELAVVAAQLRRLPKAARYRCEAKTNQIVIYEIVRPDMTKMIADMIKQGMLISPREAQRLSQLEEDYAHFSAVMRFTLANPERRRFLAERMVYRGEGYWMGVGQEGSIFELATRLVPTLGTEEFFELW
jgi:hypothetical protein